jgi:SAM-dependent methyltransferase
MTSQSAVERPAQHEKERPSEGNGTTPPPEGFDTRFFVDMYRTHSDPWGLRAHFYEHRKRALILACLPRERFRQGFEPGCATGELTALLARRCDHLIATDVVHDAVDACRIRMKDAANVTILQGAIPQDWVTQRVDLIVISELAYYLDDARLVVLAQRILASLDQDGVLLLCHWKPMISGACFDGESVHARLAGLTGLHVLVRHEEPDFLLEVWTRDAGSVAKWEGII